MNSISKFITCYIPVHACNFRCQYCYLSHHQDDAYGGGIKPLVCEPEIIAKSLSPERLGGICYFNLCAAGETMMLKEIVKLVDCLTEEGHFVDIVTNGTLSRKFDTLIDTLDANQKKRTFIKFSFHYIQLLEKNLLETFVSNVNKIKEAGISYSVEITPHDELIPYIDEIKDFSLKNFGALPHITVARNEATKDIALLSKYNKEVYKKIWGVFDSPLFDFKLRIFNERRDEFCYAGCWSLAVNLEDGYYSQCYVSDRLGNIKDLDKPINFRPVGKCREPHCFNGHAFLAFGDIPTLEHPTYLAERDRVTSEGNHWVQSEEAREFFSSDLQQSNQKLSLGEQATVLKKNEILKYLNYFTKAQDKIKDRLENRK